MNRLTNILKNKYMFYGISTLFGKGYEYIVILIAAAYFGKDIYGEFEFYKKNLELLSVLVSFGTPTLILTYTKSKNSKINFTFLSLVLSTLVLIMLFPVLYYFNLTILFIPLIFYSFFYYSSSIIQSFNLVYYGSNYSSKYKIVVSILFNSTVLIFIFFTNYNSLSLVNATYISIIVLLLFYSIHFYKFHILGKFYNIKKYYSIFTKLLFSSFSLVINNFVNMAFLITDIYIIKILSENPNPIIAEYSFPLNIANVLLLIPLTVMQVDLESVKKNHQSVILVIKKISKYLLLGIPFVFLGYFVLVYFFYSDYISTLLLFTIILIAKIIQGFTMPYGMLMLIKKMFKQNLLLNMFVLLLNIIISYFFYTFIGVIGIALTSVSTLAVRYYLTKKIALSQNVSIK